MKGLKHFALAALVAAAACGGSDSTGLPNTTGGNPSGGNPTGGNPTGGSDTPVATTAVGVSDNSFTPANIVVAVGSTVTWTWTAGSSAHNVTFGDGTQSGDKSSGATYTRTFSTAGSFNYTCPLHAGMNGTVKVN